MLICGVTSSHLRSLQPPMPLPARKLGSQGCEASAVGLGCMSLVPGGALGPDQHKRHGHPQRRCSLQFV